MIADHVGVDRAEVGASSLESYTRFQAGEEFRHAVDASGNHRGGKVVRAGHDVGDDFGVGGVGNGGFEDADNSGGATHEANAFANHGGIAVECVLPESVGENGGTRGLRAVILLTEQAPENGMQAHDFEVGAANDSCADFARFAEADEGEANRGEVAEFAQRLDACLEVLDFRDGEGGVVAADAAGALANVDETILVAIDERPEKHAANHAEDGGVSADAKGEGENNGDRTTLAAPKRADGELEIAAKKFRRKGHGRSFCCSQETTNDAGRFRDFTRTGSHRR